MGKPRYRRRKEDRPDELAAAAFEEFASQGYAATRVEDVAKRAGVSKGLLYLYYKTKEELFKAVVRNVVVRRIDALIETLDADTMTAEEFIRGPMLTLMKRVPHSRMGIVIRLLISEGPRHPDLVEYYWEHVVSKGLAAIERFMARAVERGEFRPSAATLQPQLFVAPIIVAVVWKSIFANKALDTDALMESQCELMLTALKA